MFLGWGATTAWFAFVKSGVGAATGAAVGVLAAISADTLGPARIVRGLAAMMRRTALRLFGYEGGVGRWALVGAAAIIAGISLLPWWMAVLITQSDLVKVSYALVLSDGLRAAGTIFLGLWAILSVGQFLGRGRIALETMVLAWLFAEGWRGHRYGYLDRPHFFGDVLSVNGYGSAERGFSALAVCLLLVIGLHWVGSRLVRSDARISVAGVVTCVLLVSVSFGGIEKWWSISRISPPPPHVPPLSFAADPPPPPIPEPQQIALVELGLPLYVPGAGSAAYYFRIEEFGADNVPGKGSTVSGTLTENNSNTSSAQLHTAQVPVPVHTITINLRETSKSAWWVPGQVGIAVFEQPLPSFISRQKLLAAQAPSAELDSDDLENLDRLAKFRFDEPRWSEAFKSELLAVERNAQIDQLLLRILTPLRGGQLAESPPSGSALAKVIGAMEDASKSADGIPAARIVAIREWMEANFVLNDQLPTPKGNDEIAKFIFNDKTGTEAHFVEAGLILLRVAGIPSRVAKGYRVQMEKQRPARFLITDQHAADWIEIYLDGAGWRPWQINPRQVLAQRSTPPAKAKQDEVLRQIDTDTASASSLQLAVPFGIVFALFFGVTAAGICFVFLRPLFRYQQDFVKFPPRLNLPVILLHRWALGQAVHLLELSVDGDFAGANEALERRYGENWAQFGQRLKAIHQRDQPLSEALDHFTRLAELAAIVETASDRRSIIPAVGRQYSQFSRSIFRARWLRLLLSLRRPKNSEVRINKPY